MKGTRFVLTALLALMSTSLTYGQYYEVNKDIHNTGDTAQVGYRVDFKDPVDVVFVFRGRFTNVTFSNPPGDGHPTTFICWTNAVPPIEPDEGVHVGWVVLNLGIIVSMSWTDNDCQPVSGEGRNIQVAMDFGSEKGREGGHASWTHEFLDGNEPPGSITLTDLRYLTTPDCYPLDELNAQNEELNERLLLLDSGPVTLNYGETLSRRIPGGVDRSDFVYMRFDVSGDDDAFARDWTGEQALSWKWDWPDYAPGGIPDFSQDHSTFPLDTHGNTTYDGPSALANCLWWFDSKMEGRCGGMAGDGEDDYPLVTAHTGVLDDHSPENVEPLIQSLAQCMQTDVFGPGTRMVDMESCARTWIAGAGEQRNYTIRRVSSPRFDQIACEIERSENVILQLGFWWSIDGSVSWTRCGGHYVTAAGVNIRRHLGPDGLPGSASVDDDIDGEIDEEDELCPCGPNGITVFGDDECGVVDANECGGLLDMLALSDPGTNNAEPPPSGNDARARVRGANHGDHAPAAVSPPSHDDSANASHDSYEVVASVTGLYDSSLRWYRTTRPGVPTGCSEVNRWCGHNPAENGVSMQACTGAEDELIAVEIESMLDISPVITDVCIDVRPGINRMRLHKGRCPGPALTTHEFDYIRGELCQLSKSAGIVDLKEVDCLSSDDFRDQYLDTTTWDITRGIKVWFYLVRQEPATDYGLDSDGAPRVATSGDCP